MRKIDKSAVLSSIYAEWLHRLEQNNKAHPAYSSTTFRFYTDIVMSLYHCQDGLCAYTERRLCESQVLDFNLWKDGKYSFDCAKTEGQLDHFDAALKNGKAWLWDNLFMVLGKANNDKGEKSIDSIMKPDAPDYDPFLLLEYDYDLDEFIPNLELPEDLQRRIQRMIETLCINAEYVKLHRKPFIRKIKQEIELGHLTTWEEVDEPKQFPTAFEMLRRQRISNP